MNKKLAILGFFVGSALISALIALSSMGFIIKKTVNQVTHIITGTDAELLSSSLNIMTGKAEMKRLLIGNPKDAQTPLAIRMTSAQMQLTPSSLASDLIKIESLKCDNLEVFWNGQDGENFKIIEANIEKFAEKERAIIEDLKSRGLEDEHKYFILESMELTNTKVYLTDGEKEYEFIIPSITLKNIGSEQQGASFVDLLQKSIREITISCSQHINQRLNSQTTKKLETAE